MEAYLQLGEDFVVLLPFIRLIYLAPSAAILMALHPKFMLYIVDICCIVEDGCTLLLAVYSDSG